MNIMHTFWFMEELFVAPLHYGFVFFGWLALGIAGVLLQVFASFSNLIGDQVVEAVDKGLIAK
jgi:methane/ammonia monooxygenase subunit C